MSFVKIPRRTARPSAPHTKRKTKRKPAWDDTNNDLSVHKATPDEIARRKYVHKSKNVDLVQAEKLHKKISKAKQQSRTPSGKRQMPLLREVLYDQNQLQDVLAKSDRAMAVVRDLFGDDPKRYRGLPNVTAAPHLTYLDGSLPTGTTIDGPSKLDVLSDTVMDKSALNEYEHGTESEDEEGEALQYKPLLDFGRFRKFLEAEQERAIKEDNPMKAQDAQEMAKRLEQEMAELGIKSPEEVDLGQGIPVTSPHDGSFIEEQTPATTPKLKAMNDTGKVNRVRSRLGQTQSDQPQQVNTTVESVPANNSILGGTFNMEDLRKVLNGLEGNLAAYERQTGRPQVSRSAPPETFSGYTMSLVSAVNKLTVYLKESEIRLRAETTLREQLTEDVDQLKSQLENLALDMITTQEDYTSVQDEFYKYRLSTQQEIHLIKTALVTHGITIGNMSAEPATSSTAQPAANLIPNGNQNLQPERDTQPQQLPTNRAPQPFSNQQQHSQQAAQQQEQQQLQQQQLQQQQLQLQKQMQKQQQQQPSRPLQPQQQQPSFPQKQHHQQPSFPQKQHQQQPSFPQNQHPQQYQRPPVPPQALNSINNNLTSQHLQMMMQQMMMSQGLPGVPVTGQPIPGQDVQFSQQSMTEDASSLEQHPLSSSMTSQSTVKTTSSGLPVPNLPQQIGPASVLPATLLTPPRQGNSPQVPGKSFNGQKLATAMAMFRQDGLLDHMKNVAANQKAALQNGSGQVGAGDDQNSPQGMGQFRPIPVDTLSNSGQGDNYEPNPLYFNQMNNNPSRPAQNQLSQRSGPSREQLANTQNMHKRQGEHHANISISSSTSGGPAERVVMNRELLVKQIEELNRQHAEAEGKLGRLLQHQYTAVKALTEVAPPNRVSPSISPIPGSESDVGGNLMSDISSINYSRENNGQNIKPGTRGITISLPQMEMLNWSDTSTPTLATSRTQSRRDSDSPVPVVSVSPSGNGETPFKDNQKVNPQSAFFALSTHVS